MNTETVQSTHTLMPVFPIIALISVLIFLASERINNQVGRWGGKMAASTVFVLFAVYLDALESVHGQALMVALLCSWVGDLLLLPGKSRWFLYGLVSFLLAHIAFALCFIQRGIDTGQLLIPGAGVGLLVLVISYWLLRHVEKEMKLPVLGYMAAIVVMVILAFATHHHLPNATIPVAACLFLVSDLFVARDRFVKKEAWNRIIGTPLYFGAQMIFAAI
ncbi:MAG: lysoplasmalogenase [Candidatus Neomarinimicrobiota bacterium]|nr:lysoplasmalogenase [Candidatus Neomarinimicrobiota bacterium]